MPYQSGDILLNKYIIETVLGQGAFGDVYLVTHLGLTVKRALKVLRRDAPGVGSTEFNDGQMRFQLEAQLGASLNTPTPHPNLLQVHNFEASENLLVLEMEYAPGGSLAERLATLREENKQMPIKEALAIALEIANGLAVLHERDIVHRDLKPSNILFDDKGHAKVADLGLAQVPGGPSLRSQLSNPMPHPGTPGYMSPEQENDGGYLTPASDVYSLGTILFEMLTGRMYRSIRPGILISHLRPEIFPSLEEHLTKILNQFSNERPWDGHEASLFLQSILVPKTNSPQNAATHFQMPLQNPKIERSEYGNLRKISICLFNDVMMDFVRIPSGWFWMGNDKNQDPEAYDDEMPRHKVSLDEYLIGKGPVTNRQYAIFVNQAGVQSPAHWKNGRYPPELENHPVVNISWQDAGNFCAWLAHLTGLPIRLPTEAEWEKAARGDGERLYPWGNQKPNANLSNFENQRWFRIFGNSGKTTPVGRYSPQGDSPYGCVDMAGNVCEWCSDWYAADYYKNSPIQNPIGPAVGRVRVLRGGGWHINERNIRCADRGSFEPTGIIHFIGFRCACSALQPTNASLPDKNK